ncbi:MAG: ribosome-associated translation inhibitor RaiA [Oscillospiraceae bacterium]
MKFQYSEKKVKLPGNVHAYAEKKVMKLARFFEEDAEALIVFSVEKNQNKVELTVHGAGTWFRASESTSDMFASIDAAVATIEGQIPQEQDPARPPSASGCLHPHGAGGDQLRSGDGGRRSQPEESQELLLQAHDPRRSGHADEPAGAQFRVP